MSEATQTSEAANETTNETAEETNERRRALSEEVRGFILEAVALMNPHLTGSDDEPREMTWEGMLAHVNGQIFDADSLVDMDRLKATVNNLRAMFKAGDGEITLNLPGRTTMFDQARDLFGSAVGRPPKPDPKKSKRKSKKS